MKGRGLVMDLIEKVEAEPGWRVVDTANGWRIYPPDPLHSVIHIRDFRELDFCKTALRRAGFKPLMTLKEQKQMALANKAAPVLVASNTLPAPAADPPPPPPTDLVAEARRALNDAIEALSRLDAVLGQIEVERSAVVQLRQLLQVLK